MQPGFARYSLVGNRRVDGWVVPGTLPLVAALSREQVRRGITGGIVEIGVHHGRLLIGLHLLREAGEQTVALDLFDDQAANVFRSGLGDEASLRRNLARYCGGADTVKIVRADSTTLDGDDVKAMAGGPVRLFSVDGGHTAEIVAHDMATAADSLTAGGIVIADDVFHERWPGVFEGTLRFLDTNDDLVPFAIGFNKTLFTQRAYSANYRAIVAEVARRNIWKCKTTFMHDEPVAVAWVPGVRERSRLAAKRLLRPQPRTIRLPEPADQPTIAQPAALASDRANEASDRLR